MIETYHADSFISEIDPLTLYPRAWYKPPLHKQNTTDTAHEYYRAKNRGNHKAHKKGTQEDNLWYTRARNQATGQTYTRCNNLKNLHNNFRPQRFECIHAPHISCG